MWYAVDLGHAPWAGQALGIEEANTMILFLFNPLWCLRGAYIAHVLRVWIDKDPKIKIWFPQDEELIILNSFIAFYYTYATWLIKFKHFPK